MTFAELRTELAERGFDYLATARRSYFINRSYQEICGSGDYPFLEATTTGVAPLAISDLRTVESVVDTTSTVRLIPLDRRHIMETDYTLATTGSPTYYYLTSGTTVAVYPANTTDTLSVRYWKVPADLSADGDTPAIPSRFHQLIVDGAVHYAYLDADNFEAAGGILEQWLRGRNDMDNQLLVGQHDRVDDFVTVTTSPGDW